MGVHNRADGGLTTSENEVWRSKLAQYHRPPFKFIDPQLRWRGSAGGRLLSLGDAPGSLMTVSSQTAPAPIPLFERFPALRERCPRVVLTRLPTPVDSLERLGAEIGRGDIWIKRDDRSGRIIGGNKPRKLEFIYGDLERRGIDKVVSFGGIGTNHGLAMAIYGREIGIRTSLVLLPQPVTRHVKEVLRALVEQGAEIHLAGGIPGAAFRTAALYARHGRRLGFVWVGGSSRLGVLGYVNAGLEIADDVRAGRCPEPERIYLAVGSAGTLAGLLLGLRLASLRAHIVGILVSDAFPITTSLVRFLARRTLRLLRRRDPSVPPVPIRSEDFSLRAEYLGRAYGAPTRKAEQAIALAGDTEGILLDEVYTGKAMAGLIDLESKAGREQGAVLFLNTFNSLPLPAPSTPFDPAGLPPLIRAHFEAPEAEPVNNQSRRPRGTG